MKAVEKYIKNQLKLYNFLENPKAKVSHNPNNIYIEPTNACNLRCKCCARGGGNAERKLGFMEFENFKKVIDKIVDSDWYPPLTLIGHGESLLHKEIFSMIKYAKEKGLNVSLISNSTLLTEEKIKSLIDSGLDRFQTMFESLNKEEFESIRVGANHEKTKANILKMIEMNEAAGHPIFISIGLVDTSLTTDKEETKKFWESQPIDNFYFSPLLTLQADSGLYEEGCKLKEKCQKGLCVTTFIAMCILYNGDVTICPQDFNGRWITGNIFKDSLEEVWNGEKAQQLRTAIIENNEDFFEENKHRCHKCNTPYIEEYQVKGHMKSMPSMISRKIKSYLLKGRK